MRAVQSTIKKVIQSLKFSKLRQAWENPVLQWVVLLQIINSDKQASSKEKIVSIPSILSKQKNEKLHNSPEQSRCYSFSLLLSFAIFVQDRRSPPFSLISFSCFCFRLCFVSWLLTRARCYLSRLLFFRNSMFLSRFDHFLHVGDYLTARLITCLRENSFLSTFKTQIFNDPLTRNYINASWLITINESFNNPL